MNNSHQQSPKENIESKCKKNKKHTLVAQGMELCRNFQQDINLKKMNSRRRRRIGKGKGKMQKLPLLILSLVYLKKQKVKSNEFFDFGEKLHKCPPTSPNYQN